MRRRENRIGMRCRRYLAALLTWPLLQTAGCYDIGQRSIINGFFNGFNAWLVGELGTAGDPAGAAGD